LCALLGSFAGNVALTLGARGGVYIGGGIVPRFGGRFFASDFRARFEAKGRFRSYLEGIPTVLITDTLAALTGAAVALEQSAAEGGTGAGARRGADHSAGTKIQSSR
jgi:glucokinase